VRPVAPGWLKEVEKPLWFVVSLTLMLYSVVDDPAAALLTMNIAAFMGRTRERLSFLFNA
jgi:hypothetical protein